MEESRRIRIAQTIATITAAPEYIPLAVEEIRRRRAELEAYIRRHPEFATTLEPLEVADDAPEIARRMAAAAAVMGVGPMAAVAGAVAECAVRVMVDAGSRQAIVDNGGDIAMVIERPVTVGIFTGRARIRDIALVIPPQAGIVSVCTSSGTVGHSLSFGRADAAVVIAGDAFLADAAATALGNALRIRESAAMAAAMKPLLRPGIRGMIGIMDDLLAACGDIPEIVRVPVPIEKISTVQEEE